VLLLSRQTKRARPEEGSSNSDEERGGQAMHTGKRVQMIELRREWLVLRGAHKSMCHDLPFALSVSVATGTRERLQPDRILCVNQGWCEIFGFIDETASLENHNIEESLGTAGVPMEEICHPLFDTSRTVSLWSKKKGHSVLSFRVFHVFSIQLGDSFHEVLAFTFTDVTVQQRVEQALLLAHQQSRRSEQAKQAMIGQRRGSRAHARWPSCSFSFALFNTLPLLLLCRTPRFSCQAWCRTSCALP